MSETVGSPSTATTRVGRNKGFKKGIPATGLPVAEDAAEKLWSVARRGTASQDAFARQFGSNTKASGGAWRSRIAMLRGFNLIRLDGTEVGLSDLGLQIVNPSEPAKQIGARQTAVMHLKAYRELVDDFDGTQLPDATTLATRLQFDYGRTPEMATRAADAFIESLKHAQMIDDNGFVRKAGITGAATTPLIEPPPVDSPAEELTEADAEAQAEEIENALQEEGGLNAEQADDNPDFRSSRTGPPIGTQNHQLTLNVTLDLSNFRAEDVIQILGALGISRDDS